MRLMAIDYLDHFEFENILCQDEARIYNLCIKIQICGLY